MLPQSVERGDGFTTLEQKDYRVIPERIRLFPEVR